MALTFALTFAGFMYFVAFIVGMSVGRSDDESVTFFCGLFFTMIAAVIALAVCGVIAMFQ